jgi:predicted RNA-binding protein with PUA-like domain
MARAYWLMKSEPNEWSWDDQVKAKTAPWEGIRNFQAANNMKAMKPGDRAFFYHTGNEKRIVGVVEVTRLYHPDPSDETGRFGMVEVRALAPVKRPVTLGEIRAEPKLANLALIRQSRLSVVPVDAESWALLSRMAGIAPGGGGGD